MPPSQSVIRAIAIPRLDQGAKGIHLAWSGPELNPLARGGYEIRRRLHREIKTTSTCARFDAPRLARLSALGWIQDQARGQLLCGLRIVRSELMAL